MPVALITGAASGIGLALTRHFHAQGWSIALADLNVTAGERLAQELGPRTFFLRTDVSVWEDLAALFKETKRRFGRLDYVAANAGVADMGSLYQRMEGEPQKPNLKTIDIDLNGQIFCLTLAIYYFRLNEKKGGTVVFTSSSAGLYKFPTNPQYCAAKYGVCLQTPNER
jgi:15-hydroxyprostaglandin dehydrogenase (NAD)